MEFKKVLLEGPSYLPSSLQKEWNMKQWNIWCNLAKQKNLDPEEITNPKVYSLYKDFSTEFEKKYLGFFEKHHKFPNGFSWGRYGN